MIFYFSGTGNSTWVALQIAEKTQDIALNIATLDEIPKIENEDTFV